MEDNLIPLVTFADGGFPPCIKTAKDAGLPFRTFLQFNNSALYDDENRNDLAANVAGMAEGLRGQWWQLMTTSFDGFIDYLRRTDNKNSRTTAQVLMKRKELYRMIGELEVGRWRTLEQLNDCSTQFACSLTPNRT